mmetsp:Transcript_44033/g.71680  ORF Transcript_44033/g.71680 Transcript_44033/m.71680 type:complete len:180 (+) Transcript_44033:167-706(+)
MLNIDSSSQYGSELLQFACEVATSKHRLSPQRFLLPELISFVSTAVHAMDEEDARNLDVRRNNPSKFRRDSFQFPTKLFQVSRHFPSETHSDDIHFVKDLRFVFDIFDSKSTGQISFDSLRIILERLGRSYSNLAYVEENETGAGITFGDFRQMMLADLSKDPSLRTDFSEAFPMIAQV